MPTFTYECPECESQWDEKRDRTDKTLNLSEQDCPRCGVPVGYRVFNPGTVTAVFRGEGWARKAGTDSGQP